MQAAGKIEDVRSVAVTWQEKKHKKIKHMQTAGTK
jgi:hypothetical protein